VQRMSHAVCTGSFGVAFAKCLWPLVKEVEHTVRLTDPARAGI